ncbi:MAG: hypothetical protein ACP5UM_08830 [Anaerolineae bacterium]
MPRPKKYVVTLTEEERISLLSLLLRRDGAAGAQKNDLKPWQKRHWCMARVTADFVWRMEDVLDLYAEP